MASYMPPPKSDIHITPDRVWELIERWWGHSKEQFFDPCPLNPSFDGLTISWKPLNFVNPPYSLLKEFVYKAINESLEYGNKSILLLPTKTDQRWFHDLVEKRADIRFIQKRLKFKNNKWSATQPHFLAKLSTIYPKVLYQ